jgi:hypothetical protein
VVVDDFEDLAAVQFGEGVVYLWMAFRRRHLAYV